MVLPATYQTRNHTSTGKRSIKIPKKPAASLGEKRKLYQKGSGKANNFLILFRIIVDIYKTPRQE